VYRLGGEKFKSKGSSRIPTPTWLEQFDLHLFDDQTQELEINVCAKERSREEIIARYDFYFCKPYLKVDRSPKKIYN